jgi:hypothetical protein
MTTTTLTVQASRRGRFGRFVLITGKPWPAAWDVPLIRRGRAALAPSGASGPARAQRRRKTNASVSKPHRGTQPSHLRA